MLDVASEAPLHRTMTGHGAPVVAAAFAADGGRLASVSAKNELLAFDVAAAKVVLRAELPEKPFGLAVSPDGRRIAIAYRDRIELRRP